MRNTKGKKSPENQRSSRRIIFCHNSLNVKLIFTNVLPHDSHQSGEFTLQAAQSTLVLKVPLCSEFNLHPSTIFLSLSSSEIICSILVIDFKIIH